MKLFASYVWMIYRRTGGQLRDFQIVDIPNNCALLSVDHLVRDAPIIRVDFETPRNEGGTELASK